MSILIRRLLAASFVIGGTALVSSFLYSTFSGIALVALSAVLIPVSLFVFSLLLIPVTLIIFKVITLFTKKPMIDSLVEATFSKKS